MLEIRNGVVDVEELLRGEGIKRLKELSREMRTMSTIKDGFATEVERGEWTRPIIEFPEHTDNEISDGIGNMV